MKAAERFIHRWLLDPGRLHEVARIRADVYGSLALTGRGHGTDKAILLGLEGQRPNLIDPDIIPATLERIRSSKRIQLMGQHEIAFDEKRDLGMNKRQKLPYHTNGMRFSETGTTVTTLSKSIGQIWCGGDLEPETYNKTQCN